MNIGTIILLAIFIVPAVMVFFAIFIMVFTDKECKSTNKHPLFFNNADRIENMLKKRNEVLDENYDKTQWNNIEPIALNGWTNVVYNGNGAKVLNKIIKERQLRSEAFFTKKEIDYIGLKLKKDTVSYSIWQPKKIRRHEFVQEQQILYSADDILNLSPNYINEIRKRTDGLREYHKSARYKCRRCLCKQRK